MAQDTDKLGPITVIGPGRVGTAIHAAALAEGLASSLLSRTDLEAAKAGHSTPDLVILAVPDREIRNACALLSATLGCPRLTGHTSGATGLSALDDAAPGGRGAFSIHPLQTYPGKGESVLGTPCAITASDEATATEVTALANRLGMVPFRLQDEARAGYHAAASIASNFLVALEESAVQAMARAGIEGGRELLAPLVSRTVENWELRGPGALTGPIARGDETTVEAHLDWIEAEFPEIADMYRALAKRARSVVAAEASR